MMFFLLVGVVFVLAGGVLVCVKHDVTHLYVSVKRIVIGFVLAFALGSVLYAAEVPVLGCNDFEKYSFIWYLNGCFLWEHSS